MTTTAEDITVDSAEDTEASVDSVEDTAVVFIIIIITLTKYFTNLPSYCNLIFTTAANELIPVLSVT